MSSVSLESNETAHFLWGRLLFLTAAHLLAIYGIILLLTTAQWMTVVWTAILFLCSGMGITAGAHRLWAHRSYKANCPLRLILLIFNTIAMQTDVISWAQTHRCHHKFSETNADPHNSKRGFWFSHIGWIVLSKHPDRKRAESDQPIIDLLADPMLCFQKRHYAILVGIFCFLLPTVLPVYFWQESALTSFLSAVVVRWIAMSHATWTVNSFAHRHGTRPFDTTIEPRQNYLAIVATLGEGWHNFHHCFPFDYRASEFKWFINGTSIFIDFFAFIGWVTDRKTASNEMITKRKLRTGDADDEDTNLYD